MQKNYFIDINYNETKKSRLERAREKQDEYLEDILKIEHEIISSQKRFSDLLVTKDYEVKAT